VHLRKASSPWQRQRQAREERPLLVAGIEIEVVAGFDVGSSLVGPRAEHLATVDAGRRSFAWYDIDGALGPAGWAAGAPTACCACAATLDARPIGATPARFEVIVAVAMAFVNAAG
jgi:hypothetical protein